MMMKASVALFMGCFLFVGCYERKINHNIQTELEGADITIVLIESKKQESESYSAIYGTIVIEPKKGSINYVDLSCFKLSYNGLSTDDVYIDSVAHYNSERVGLNSSGRFEYPLYWIIKATLDSSELSGFMMEGENHSRPCIKYMDPNN